MNHTNRRAILGLLLVITGILLLLENLRLIPGLPYWLFTWPMILVGLGILNLISGNRTAAIILIGIGTLFILQDIYYIRFKDYWPVILIIVGLAFIFRQKSESRGSTLNDDYFDALNIFGGGNQRIASHKLRGGKITSIFGGSEIDLSESKPVSGSVIDVFTMFGGAEIKVPNDWNVKIEVTSILGGFSDKRKNVSISESSPVVVIKGTTLLGGGEIS